MPNSSRNYGFYGKGWSFPLTPATGALSSYIGGEEKIRQSIWLILSTAPGERQMRPDFGCGIHDLAFQPNTVTFRAQVQSSVRDALIRWEPRIDVLDVRVEAPEQARNYMLIHIDYRILDNNAFHNLVYPFFINEGVGL